MSLRLSATVAALYRYPVKSMIGESLQSAVIGPLGIPGDRAWALRDETQGGLAGGKRFAALMNMSARVLEEVEPGARSPLCEITIEGRSLRTDSEDVHMRLSAAVHSPVTLWPLLAEHPAFAAELAEYPAPPGTYFDAYPLLLLSRQSLASMQAEAPRQRFDVRRFRPNLRLDFAGTEHPFPEQEWLGRTLRFDARLCGSAAGSEGAAPNRGAQRRQPRCVREREEAGGDSCGEWEYRSRVRTATWSQGLSLNRRPAPPCPPR